MRIAAIDPSYTGFGVAVIEPLSPVSCNLLTCRDFTLKGPSKKWTLAAQTLVNNITLIDNITLFLCSNNIDRLVIETPAYRGGSSEPLHGLQGALVTSLARHNSVKTTILQVVEHPEVKVPKTYLVSCLACNHLVNKLIHSSGKVTKTLITATAKSILQTRPKGQAITHNIATAIFLAMLGSDYYYPKEVTYTSLF